MAIYMCLSEEKVGQYFLIDSINTFVATPVSAVQNWRQPCSWVKGPSDHGWISH